MWAGQPISPSPVPSLQNIPFRSHLYSYHWQFEGVGILTFPKMIYEILQHRPLRENLTVSRGGAPIKFCKLHNSDPEPLCDSSQLHNSDVYSGFIICPQGCWVCTILLCDFDWFLMKTRPEGGWKQDCSTCKEKLKLDERWQQRFVTKDEKNHLIFGTKEVSLTKT